MSLASSLRRAVVFTAAVVVPTTSSPKDALGQAALSAADVQELRTALLADLEVMRGKYVQLAQAFPQEKYSWRPMEGVRSVAEVLMLSAFEGYAFIPNSLGGQRFTLSQEEATRLRQLTDKTRIIEQIEKGFAHARQQIETIDAATLGAPRNLFGAMRNAPGVALLVFGDLHEHLGQLIAYARMNQIVPPWSR